MEYDRACASIPEVESEERVAQGEAHVVRLKVPPEPPEFRDLVYGKVGRPKSTIEPKVPAYEDPILLKSDGLPTYHLANVVDDHHMKITHVIRAAEWISSTPNHLALYDAFQWTPPAFAHVGLLQDDRAQKLSKRQADTGIATYLEEQEIFPDALANYVALLGWSHKRTSDVMSMRELIDNFDLSFTKGNAKLNPAKLSFLQRAHAQRIADERGDALERVIARIVRESRKVLPSAALDRILRGRRLDEYFTAIFSVWARNYTTASDFLARNAYFFGPPTELPVLGADINAYDLSKAVDQLREIPASDWTAPILESAIADAVASLTSPLSAHPAVPAGAEGVKREEEAEGAEGAQGEELKRRDQARTRTRAAVYRYLRAALAGGQRGPSIDRTMVILGRDETCERLEKAAAVYGIT
ncbi:MAG: Glutamate--tRNA ligase mitochondrial [Thelocarpon superellum]|nr:MAG: Glutamate--tRNA ligase mitochondrial [Thelocarpon superellum]